MRQQQFAAIPLRRCLEAVVWAGILATSPISLGGGSAKAQDDGFASAFTDGTPSLEVRPRYEAVGQEGKHYGDAGTVRTLLGFSTKPIEGLGATLQFIDVASINSDHYNNGSNGRTRYALILDPQGTNINQGFLSYAGPGDTTFKAGRQIIDLDSQRFVGSVNFRQNMQTFDAVSVSNGTLPDLKLFGSYAWGIKDIANQYVSSRIYLTEANWTPRKEIQIDGFGYWYGNETPLNQPAIAGSAACLLAGNNACNNATYGGRVHGVFTLPGQIGFSYLGTYAKQSSFDGGSSLIDADFWHGGGKLTWQSWFAGIDYMVMGSHDGLYGFQTPLATKHAFNGWAEQFLTTPKMGLDSLYGSVGGKVGGVDVRAIAYRFRSDTGGLTYGDESDFSVSYPLTRHIGATAEFADFISSNTAYKTTRAGWLFLLIHY